MQQILGLIFIAVGVMGMSVYAAQGMFITKDDKITMLLGFFMVLIGIMIMYGNKKKKNSREHERNPGD